MILFLVSFSSSLYDYCCKLVQALKKVTVEILDSINRAKMAPAKRLRRISIVKV